MKQRVRIADVAKLAGVSPGTVSAVINDRVGERIRVSEKTQDRVWDAVRELQFVANPAARSLAGGQNRMLGVFTYESIFPVEHHNFYYRFLVGIEQEAEREGYDLILFTSAGGDDGRRLVYRNDSNRLRLADGAILLGLQENKQELQQLRDEGYPFVFIGRRDVADGQISYVGIDYTQATIEVAACMVENGHSRIVYVGSYEKQFTEPSIDREQGYYQALKRFDVPYAPEFVIHLRPDDLSTGWLSTFLTNGVTAFMVEDDALGLSLLKAANELHKSAPADFSMSVLGNPLTSSTADIPDWATFLVPRREIGVAAVRQLVEMVENRGEAQLKQIMLPCTFVRGNTIGPAPL